MPAGRPGTLLVGSQVTGSGTALLRREVEGLARCGDRVTALAESQGQLLTELRLALQEFVAGPEGSRGRVADAARELGEILGWCDAVQCELVAESERAVQGLQPIDLLLLCHDVVHDLGDPDVDRQVQITGAASHSVWGRVPAFGRLLRLAFELVAQRTAGWSDLQVTVSEDGESPMVRVHGLDGARAEPEAQRVADFRAAVTETGIEVRPDASGASGTGLVLWVPPLLRGPLV